MAPLLRVPLFYKILIANAGILVLGTAAGMVVALRLSPEISAATAFVGSGMVALAVLALGSLVHTYLIGAALSPLRRLEETAHRVEAGDMDARADTSPLADREMVRLVRVFNLMLDTLASLRRKERARSACTLKALENERFRTSRELLDQLGQTLAGVLVRIRSIIADTSGVSDRLMEGRLEEVRSEVFRVTEHLDRVARRLHPPELDDLGLGAAITALARRMEQTSGLMVDVVLASPLPRLEPEAQLAVFRIVQEALGNSAKHARARQVNIALEVADDRLEVEIHDDGRGFEDPDPDTDREGLGLSGMLDRAAHAGGTLQVDSRPGEGTRVTLSVPIVRGDPVRNGSGGRRLTAEAPKPLPERVGNVIHG
ncbi:MAG: HAMP domain-containing protein [Gemmatimonadetes bacterium]|nr:HAMP domain-containing protein [Gemmatimonadota bacterium]